MLFMENTPKNAGVTLWSDAFTLQSIHELSHKLWDMDIISDGKLQECLMAFSYDIRKCYENDRECKEITDQNNNRIFIYGVNINWVELLIEIAFMRFCMGHTDTSKFEQSMMYLLEFHLETCLREAFPKNADNILFKSRILPQINHETLGKKFAGRSSYFLKLNNKSKRISQLLWIMESFNPLFSDKTINFEEYEFGLFEVMPNNIKW